MERMMIVCCVLWFFFWIQFQKCVGSEIKLTASPVAITNGLTDSLKLRCSLQDTAGASSVVVGRQVSATDYDIDHVNSIIISKVNANETVTSLAQIITSEDATVLGGSQTLTAAGTLTPSDPSDPEYLELTWTNPGQDQSGSYICEVNGLDPQGHSVMLQQSLAVDSVDPEVEDLVKEINDLKAMLANHDAILSTLKAPHYEEGTVSCVNSDDWTQSYASDGVIIRTFSQSVTFQQPYTTLPGINMAPSYVDVKDGANERYRYHLRDVTNTGFKIVCETWSTTHVYYLQIRWTSSVA